MREQGFPLFEPDEPFSARGLRGEQHQRLRRLWNHNRFLHGSGIVCGLWIVPAGDPSRPWAIRICPGVAIGCCGEEISVTTSTVLDIQDFMWKIPPNQEPRIAYIGLRYAETLRKPVTAPPHACCSTTNKEEAYTRSVDGFEFTVLWQLPDREHPSFDPCQSGFPPCPGEPCQFVILAAVDLPGEGVEIQMRDVSPMTG